MLVLTIEAAVWLVVEPENVYGYVLLACVILIWPHLVSWTMLSTEASLRANRGRGSSLVWERCLSRWCCGCCSPSAAAFWQRHLGTDKLVFTAVTLVALLGCCVLGAVVCLDQLREDLARALEARGLRTKNERICPRWPRDMAGLAP